MQANHEGEGGYRGERERKKSDYAHLGHFYLVAGIVSLYLLMFLYDYANKITSQSTVFELAACAAFYLLRGASGLRAESCPVWQTGSMLQPF